MKMCVPHLDFVPSALDTLTFEPQGLLTCPPILCPLDASHTPLTWGT